jgi:hypothetical protein
MGKGRIGGFTQKPTDQKKNYTEGGLGIIGDVNTKTLLSHSTLLSQVCGYPTNQESDIIGCHT